MGIDSRVNLCGSLWRVVLATSGVHLNAVFSGPAGAHSSCQDNRLQVNDSFLSTFDHYVSLHHGTFGLKLHALLV